MKWTRIAETKHKDFIDVVPIMPCQKLNLGNGLEDL